MRDPATGNWTSAGANGGIGDRGSEETWVLIANGTVVVPQVQQHPERGEVRRQRRQVAGRRLARVYLVEATSSEIGPGFLLTGGRPFFVGATNNTALYQPGATDTAAGTWNARPQIPNERQRATGAAIVATEVTLPGDLELGDSDLIVVGNGIPSAPATVVVQPQGRGDDG